MPPRRCACELQSRRWEIVMKRIAVLVALLLLPSIAVAQLGKVVEITDSFWVFMGGREPGSRTHFYDEFKDTHYWWVMLGSGQMFGARPSPSESQQQYGMLTTVGLGAISVKDGDPVPGITCGVFAGEHPLIYKPGAELDLLLDWDDERDACRITVAVEPRMIEKAIMKDGVRVSAWVVFFPLSTEQLRTLRGTSTLKMKFTFGERELFCGELPDEQRKWLYPAARWLESL